MSYPKYPNMYTTEMKVGDKVITFEVGRYSEQVSAAVLATCGETVVLTTVALGRKVDLGYFPLSVDFVEKLYASGTIKGSRWVKRDGKPLDDTILKSRVVDRTMRPLFPDGMTHEVQIINTVFSYDGENDADMIGLISTSLALAISDIPFDGPIAGLRIGYLKESGQFIFNPTHTERATSDLDLVVSGTPDAIVMVEAGANEISEEVLVDALEKAQQEFVSMCGTINEVVQDIGKTKLSLVDEPDVTVEARKEALKTAILAKFQKELNKAVLQEGKLEDYDRAGLITTFLEHVNTGKAEEELYTEKELNSALSSLMKAEARRMILEDNVRPDGRATDEIRQIWTEVDVFPRTHGSAMFKRGATQAITVVTLGAPSLGQLIESMDGVETRHYMHFYNMPPFASGEAGRIGYPKRREIGHGALAERALLPMIPAQTEFPYAIQVVSEIVSSNGSTSQASVCGSTMSLMAAGVPLKRPVAGIAMGLMSDGQGKFVILSDIQGLEDHVGDMDFKVAGTTEGVTAIQMDIKLKGLPKEILVQALQQAHAGRSHILSEMLKTIAEPRQQLSQYAPKIESIEVPTDKIGEIIGPGGKNIKNIIEVSGAQVDIEEDEERKVGMVFISSPDADAINKAATMIKNMIRVIAIGDEFDGPVVRIEPFGAFVEYLPGRDGLVHVSRMSGEFVGDPNDVVQMGQTVHVRVSEIKDDGKIGLSMLTAEQEEAARANSSSRPPFQGGRGGDRDRGGRNDRGGYRGGRDGGSRGGYSRGGDRGGRGGDR